MVEPLKWIQAFVEATRAARMVVVLRSILAEVIQVRGGQVGLIYRDLCAEMT